MSDYKRKTIVVAVTGGIACGKSEVGRILREMGFTVLDADRVAHDLMGEGTPVFKQVVDHFGERILSEDGKIARPILGEIVFGDAAERETLNGMVHPAVREALSRWIAERRAWEESAAVLIPLLFESGMDSLDFDATLSVSSPEHEVFKRLKKRGLNPKEAERRIRSQMPLAEKEELADRVVPNLGTLGELELATRQTVNAILKGEHERRKRSC